MANAESITQALQMGINSDQQALERLKKVLTDNGFKHTFMAAHLMLTEMEDMGLSTDQSIFWQSVALKLQA